MLRVALILEALGVDRETIMEEYSADKRNLARIEEKAAFTLQGEQEIQHGETAEVPSASAWFPIMWCASCTDAGSFLRERG